jgi:hypothetical protein
MRAPFVAVVVGGFACALVGGGQGTVNAEETAGSPSCGAWELEYKLDANLRLTQTPMGKGNGLYKIGPGRMVLRFDDKGGRPGGNVKMLSYEMTESFTITAKTIGFTTTVVTDSKSRATPNACGVAADGVLNENKLTWTGPVHGYRTDGTLDCSGSLCGTFGAPPPGKSPHHIGPNEVQLHPFEMSGNLETFTMPYTLVSKTKQPQQTAYVAMSAREIKRTCVAAPRPCP